MVCALNHAVFDLGVEKFVSSSRALILMRVNFDDYSVGQKSAKSRQAIYAYKCKLAPAQLLL
jgi:hypothetical protein